MSLPPDDYPFAENEFLSVRIGGAGHAERLLLIGRPVDGEVRVREWGSDSWNREGDDYDIDAAALLESIETAYASAVPVMPELYRIQLWLAGQG